MSHTHRQTLCIECGAVIGQCRCMSNDKSITYDTCNKCKAEAGGAIKVIPSDKQQLREAMAREAYLKSQIKQLTQKIEELEKDNER